MSCGCWDTSITQGETWRRVVVWTDEAGTAVPLDDATAEMSVGGTAVSITIGPEDGTLHLLLTDTETTALPTGSHDYTLWVTTGDGDRTPLLCGSVYVTA